ncbi:hypothetical protein KSS87_009944, partial [Heliosperma pusillum]
DLLYLSGDYSNHGRHGYKDEYKSSSTQRVGDKRGYTEYYKQEKETRVEYNNPTTYSGSGKSYNYNGGGGGAKSTSEVQSTYWEVTIPHEFMCDVWGGKEMADKIQHRCGLVIVDNSSVTTKQSSGPSTNKYEVTTKASNYDKPSGSYMRGTAKESYSSGDYSNHGRAGYKDEYKSSSTVRVGDQGGYTEYQSQEKVTRVEYNTSSYKNYGSGSRGYNNKYLN